MNRIIFITIFLCLFSSLFAQNEYIVGIAVDNRAGSGSGWDCNDKPYHSLRIEHALGTVHPSSSLFYFKMVARSHFSAIFYDPINERWVQLGPLTPIAGPEMQSLNDHSWEGGWCWHENWLNLNVYTNDPVTIDSVYLTNCGDLNNNCSQTNLCVDNINDYLYVTLKVQNPNNISESWLKIYSSTSQVPIYSARTNRTRAMVLLSGIQINDRFGDDLYLEMETVVGTERIYSGRKLVKFFKQIPAPTNIRVRQRACDPKLLIDLTLDPSIIAHIADFKFRACLAGNEDLSTPYILDLDSIDRNNITLLADATQYSPGSYILQIYENIHRDPVPNIKNISCARNVLFNVTEPPLPLALTHSLTSYTFNNNIYHITCYGAATGEATLTFTTGGRARLGRFEYRFGNNNTWQQIPANQLSNLTETTYRFSGLRAGPYQVRAIDRDGCESNTISINVIQPNPLHFAEIGIGLVSCHQNNAGPHANGQIRSNFTGGIGPYNITVYNSSNNPVFSLQNNSTLSFQTAQNLPVGQYRVSIADRYCASVNETTLTVGSNPQMRLIATPTPYTCAGTVDGSILLRVQNKTTNYADFTLSGQPNIHTTADTAFYRTMVTGSYNATVTNTNNCIASLNNISITGPAPLIVTGDASNPVCHNSTEGAITTSTIGGNGGYTYLWSNGASTANIGGLNHGQFAVTVTDAKGCAGVNSFFINPPSIPTAGYANQNYILCTGNRLMLEAGLSGGHEWRKEGLLLSTNQTYTFSEGGAYSLKITNGLGCVGIDSFTVKVSDHPLDAVLLLQDSATVNETIEAIDVTWPAPDSVGWFFDKPVWLGNSNEWSQQFYAESPGIVNVTLRAWYGGCFSDSSKIVKIYYSGDDQNEKAFDGMPLILGLKAFPNPNGGDFRVQVKLSRKASILLKLYSLQNTNLILSKEYDGLDQYDIPFNLNRLSIGVYVIVVRAEREQQSLKIVIDK